MARRSTCLDYSSVWNPAAENRDSLGLIDKAQYTELVTVIIPSAFVPTAVAYQLF